MKIANSTLAWILFGLALATITGLLCVDPIPQPQSYHNFADQNSYCGIPHFWNVISNLPFLIASMFGWMKIRSRESLPSRKSWLVFTIGVALVGFGSSYYHWYPNNETLVWDRMPMTIGFVAALTAISSEVFGRRVERFLWSFIAIGVASVCVWWAVDDLRFYAWVQFFPFLALIVMLVGAPSRIKAKQHVVYAIGYYLAAKVFENWDAAVLQLTDGYMSGHPIKHLLAALGTWELIRRLKFL